MGLRRLQGAWVRTGRSVEGSGLLGCLAHTWVCMPSCRCSCGLAGPAHTECRTRGLPGSGLIKAYAASVLCFPNHFCSAPSVSPGRILDFQSVSQPSCSGLVVGCVCPVGGMTEMHAFLIPRVWVTVTTSGGMLWVCSAGCISQGQDLCTPALARRTPTSGQDSKGTIPFAKKLLTSGRVVHPIYRGDGGGEVCVLVACPLASWCLILVTERCL